MIAVLTNSLQPIRLRLPARMDVDWILVGIVVTLMSLGVLMVASASMSVSEAIYGDPWYMLLRHLIYLAIGLLALLTVTLLPTHWWQEYGWVFLVLTFLVLTLVLIPGIGKVVNGSRRWIDLGLVSVQASELAKLFMVMFFANYLSRRHEELKTTWAGVFKPLVIVCLVAGLILLEPDFGGAVVIAGTVFAMMFIAGMKLWQFASLLGAGVGLLVAAAVLSPYRLQRLITFLDPWADQFNTGYQLTQSLIAFGQGQWLGVGLGRSVQKLFYLPDAHTDFIFAIVAEELGLLGAVAVIALFAALVYRILRLSRRAMLHNNGFASLAAFGVGILFAGQVFINMGVASSLLPTKGLTLPFISYGGSSLIISCVFIGLVLRLDWEIVTQPLKKVTNRGQ